MFSEKTADCKQLLTEEEIFQTIEEAFAGVNTGGKRILVLIPDRTRTAPIPLFFRSLCTIVGPDSAALDFLVALGTHPPLSEAELCRLVGISPEERNARYRNVGLFNHQWQNPDQFVQLGLLSRNEIAGFAGEALKNLEHDAGLLRDVPVTLNRMILDYDLLVVCGPVFPHEVVGFSGGNKYFFPGIAGPDLINFSHWLGAVISNYATIGRARTPVRQVIDRAATKIPREKMAVSFVVESGGIAGLFIGSTEEAWQKSASLSSRLHIRWLDEPVDRVLSVMPDLYDDLWTAAKGMYKMEPVIRDGGEVIIYSPRLTEVSYTHGALLDEIGYHVCEYFLKQWDRFKDYPGGVLAHSTHVRGLGSYDPQTGVESPRIHVTLATGIPETRCRALGLGYLPPESIDPDTWEEQGKGYLCVPRAGEILYRVKNRSQ